MRYVPDDFYPGKITFFWDSEEPYKAGWRKVTEVNEVEVHVLLVHNWPVEPGIFTSWLNVWVHV